MSVISEEYILLFNAVTDAEEALERLRCALIDAQRQAEDLFLREEDGGAPGGGGKTVDLLGEKEYNRLEKAP